MVDLKIKVHAIVDQTTLINALPSAVDTDDDGAVVKFVGEFLRYNLPPTMRDNVQIFVEIEHVTAADLDQAAHAGQID